MAGVFVRDPVPIAAGGADGVVVLCEPRTSVIACGVLLVIGAWMCMRVLQPLASPPYPGCAVWVPNWQRENNPIETYASDLETIAPLPTLLKQLEISDQYIALAPAGDVVNVILERAGTWFVAGRC